jgi:hypothetical protein
VLSYRLSKELGKPPTPIKVKHERLADRLSTFAAELYDNDANQEYEPLLGEGRLDLEEFLRRVLR